MNKEQEDLIATGLWLLIKSNDKISSSEKRVWMYDYDKLFPEELDANQEKNKISKKGYGRSYGY